METQRKLRGHDFLPPSQAQKEIPGAGAQDSIPAADTIIHVHYFAPFGDWWISELWQDKGGRWTGFGYTELASTADGAEWGYIDLRELEKLRGNGLIAANSHSADPSLLPIVERDLQWTPKPFSQRGATR